ncbi:MAG: YidC/Oxa1 family insertase periplasmic-domain containing protein [Planctomycetota bacterium]
MDPKRLLIILLLGVSAAVTLWLVTKDGEPPAEPSPPEPAVVAADSDDAPAPDEAAEPDVSPPAEETSVEQPPADAAPVETADDSAEEMPDVDSAELSGPDMQWHVWPAAGAAPEQVTIGDVGPESAYEFRVTLDSRGASIVRTELANHFVTVADKQKYDSDPAAYEAARAANPETYKGHYPLLEPVPSGGETVAAGSTRRLWVRLLDETDSAGKPVELLWASVDQLPWELVDSDEASATFRCTVHRGTSWLEAQDQPVLELRKTFRVEPDSFTVTVSVAMINRSGQPLAVMIDQAGPTGLGREGVRSDERHVGFGRIVGEDRQVQVKLDSAKKVRKLLAAGEDVLGRSDENDAVVWIGTTNKFFGSLLYLAPPSDGGLEAPQWQADFYVDGVDEESDRFLTGCLIGAQRSNAQAGAQVGWGLKLLPDQTQEVAFEMFVGPKDRSVFADESNPLHRPIYKQLNYTSAISFSRGCFCSWPWLAFQVMGLLKLFSKVTLGNYGLAIILLVFIVRLILHPLAKKSQLSMLKMQKLAPAMAKLKEKYADDKDTLNKEMMKVYRQQGTTPILGCLPMFLQMPIWIALYTGISASVQLRHAAFLPVWITDLAAPDALFTWSTPLPLIGTSFNLLPLLLTVAMFFQTKLMPQMSQPAAGADAEKAEAQKKMMRYLMPGMMLVFFYPAPSGLTLYIMASTAAGLLDSYLIRRHVRAKEAMEAAIETTVSAPGKVARSARPKKPKGPMWFKQ